MLVTLYGENPEAEKRYSPAVCIGARRAIEAILTLTISARPLPNGET